MTSPTGVWERWAGLPEEVRLLGQISVYALVIGTAYWFVSYEAAGTVLLLGFGIATGAGFVVLWRGSRVPGGDDPAAADGIGERGQDLVDAALLEADVVKTVPPRIRARVSHPDG